jgi:type II secretory pathway pseudopilin PulG
MRRSDAEPARAEQSGFSLIETLIAAALLMLVALGVLPLFSNSIVSNVQGNLASLSANFAREEAERLIQLQFNDPELTPTSGTELESIFHYSESEERWVPDADWAGTETELYAMTTRIRQFSRAAIDNDAGDYEFEDAEVQPASASADDIHFKEIRVTVQSQPGFGGGKTTTILLYKGL